MGNFKEDIALVEAIVLDVDGVMTDNGIIPTPDGDFIRRYDAKDGYAIGAALREGLKVFVISGGRGAMLENRLQLLGVTRYYLNCMDKVATINELLTDYDLAPEQLLYMGDDIPDLECMRIVGVPVCPADAAMEVVEASRYVSEFNGGHGAVRDIIEQVMRAKGIWAKNLKGVLGISCEISCDK